MTYSQDEINEFINALQLSIITPIEKQLINGDQITICFTESAEKDERFTKIANILNGKFNNNKMEYKFTDSTTDLRLLQQFLLLSRMKEENIFELAELNSKYRNIIKAMGLQNSKVRIRSVGDVSKNIFQNAASRKMTIREISELSGITQATIHKFKKGADIRLSSLLKIAKATGSKIDIDNQTIE